jgi:hypothetical protein
LGGVSKNYPSVFRQEHYPADEDGELEPDKSNLNPDPYITYGFLNVVHNIAGGDRTKWEGIFKWKALYFLFHAQHLMDERRSIELAHKSNKLS